MINTEGFWELRDCSEKHSPICSKTEINRTLTVGCATPGTSCPGCAPKADEGACGYTPAGLRLRPLVLFGAGRALSTIATVQPLHSLIVFAPPPGGGTAGRTTVLHQLSDFAEVYSFEHAFDLEYEIDTSPAFSHQAP